MIISRRMSLKQCAPQSGNITKHFSALPATEKLVVSRVSSGRWRLERGAQCTHCVYPGLSVSLSGNLVRARWAPSAATGCQPLSLPIPRQRGNRRQPADDLHFWRHSLVARLSLQVCGNHFVCSLRLLVAFRTVRRR